MAADAARRDLAIRNPREGRVDYRLSVPTPTEVAACVETLRASQPAWRDSGLASRVATLQAFASSLNAHRDDIVAALATDTGRQRLAAQELDGVVGSIARWSALADGLLDDARRSSKAIPAVEIIETAQPYPVVAAISPWNFPLLLSFIDALPALLAGCTVFIKPSEVTPRFVAPLTAAIATVPDLPSILHVAAGDGETGAALVNAADAVAFTGSVATGRKVAAAAAARLIPAFLELGGKDPAIVLAGTDLDRATTAILRASVSATGQACQSLERIYVNREQFDDFVALLTAKAQAVPLTRDKTTGGVIGPLIFAAQADTIRRHLSDALAQGARVHCGGDVAGDDGALWIEPTVVTGVDHSMALMTDETFGPIMPVMAFDTVDEAVRLANDSRYGLSAAVFGPDETAALDVARQINAGGISVNDAGLTAFLFETEKSAFGCSGLGPSRVGPAGLTRFLRRQSLYVNRGDVVPVDVFAE
ncbi:MAG: aldehyde dehydrogenase family protein [Pseudomonadota bacterium]